MTYRLHRHSQQGLALIMVLGLVIFLSIIALNFSDNQRVSTQVTANTLASASAQAAADGAVHRMVLSCPGRAQLTPKRRSNSGNLMV